MEITTLSHTDKMMESNGSLQSDVRFLNTLQVAQCQTKYLVI